MTSQLKQLLHAQQQKQALNPHMNKVKPKRVIAEQFALFVSYAGREYAFNDPKLAHSEKS